MQKINNDSISILLADDDPEDRMLLIDGFREARLMNPIYEVEDGEELLDFLYNRNKYADKSEFPKPKLILLDLNMPKKDGREALKEIKLDDNLKSIPVVALTTSKAEEDILKTYNLGVSGYITKPGSFQDLLSIINGISKYWCQIVSLPNEE